MPERSGRNPHRLCSSCSAERDRACHRRWCDRNPDKIKALKRAEVQRNRDRYRDRMLRRQYGIGLGDYLEMLDAQGGVCAICQCPPPEKRPTLHVDHDHDTGAVRGLLCSPCNTALGVLEKNLDAAQRYLADTGKNLLGKYR